MTRLLVILPVLAGLLLPAGAPAKTRTQTVPAELVFLNAQRPGDPGNCSAVGNVRWAHVENTISARAIYLWKGKENSANAMAPPFNDTLKLVATYTVQPGFHWINVTRSWSDGPKPDTCDATRIKLEALATGPARVELTIEIDPKQCTAAQAKATKRRTAVNRLRARVKSATGKEKARLRGALKNAQKAHENAVKRVTELC